MVTKFTLAGLSLEMPDGKDFFVFLDGNGKITRGNGSFAEPMPNAFSLVQVQDCPFATPTCSSVCYVHRLEKAEQEVHAAYRHNSIVIRQILENEEYLAHTAAAFAKWIRENCQGGFRWNVSGDIISLNHARLIEKVCNMTPDVSFWLYTRSFRYIGPLLDAKNLVVNLSADQDNYKEALWLHDIYGLCICYLTLDGTLPQDLPEGSVIFPSHELRGRDLPVPTQAPFWRSLTPPQRRMVCPPDFFGQSERLRCGPCTKCLLKTKETLSREELRELPRTL